MNGSVLRVPFPYCVTTSQSGGKKSETPKHSHQTEVVALITAVDLGEDAVRVARRVLFALDVGVKIRPELHPQALELDAGGRQDSCLFSFPFPRPFLFFLIGTTQIARSLAFLSFPSTCQP